MPKKTTLTTKVLSKPQKLLNTSDYFGVSEQARIIPAGTKVHMIINESDYVTEYYVFLKLVPRVYRNGKRRKDLEERDVKEHGAPVITKPAFFYNCHTYDKVSGKWYLNQANHFRGYLGTRHWEFKKLLERMGAKKQNEIKPSLI